MLTKGRNFIFIGALFMPLAANSATVTYFAEGVIDVITTWDLDDPANTFNNQPHFTDFNAFLNKTIRVEFSYENDASLNIDQSAQSDRGKYAATSLSVSIDGIEYATGSGFLYVADSLFNGGRESYWVNGQMTTSTAIAGLPVLAQEQSLFSVSESTADPLTTYLPGTGLPSELPDPFLFDVADLRLRYLDETTNLYGDVWAQSLSDFGLVTAVPLPPAIVFMGSGLLLLGARLKKKK